jgi:6-pyruvoyltetrahydropterin/6-carboxytetrahydropterin synthase
MSRVLLARRAFFSSGVQLLNSSWSEEQNRKYFGKRTGAHGHDYALNIFFTGEVHPHDGMIVNLDELKPVLAQVLQEVDGAFLNDVKYFQWRVPTLENLVNFFWNQLPHQVGAGTLARVCLEESSRRRIEKSDTFMRLTTKYEFAAAHRLHTPHLTDEENCRLYGKCNNPRGHGHNYGLEVTVEGEPDAQSGEIISPDVLNAIVDEEVFTRFDHKHLNEDCPEFVDMIPTSENLARVIFEVLQKRVDGENYRLAKIGLHETQKNYFEVEA